MDFISIRKVAQKHPEDTRVQALAEWALLARDALDHIRRTASRSITQSRRNRWIHKRAEVALEGRPYNDLEFEMPKNFDTEFKKMVRRIMRLKAREKVLQEEIAKVIYEQWSDKRGYVPWVAGGNSMKQVEAREMSRKILQEAMPKNPETGECLYSETQEAHLK